ncbi:hypothetical protein [Deinococcus sonorensis]|uniref:ZU5 domain-containing protein n=1 Tax=Deinococcus sonorensis KR-87 TaxID=694439 RepID=A0AAU7UGE6_9DEIO
MTTLLLALTACGGGPTGRGPTTTPPGHQVPVPAPIGTPTGTGVQATIGAAGGTLTTADGSVRIDIPAGALSGDQTVGLQPITRTAPGGTGQAYRLSPEGLTFARPVRLTFSYTDQDVSGSAPEVLSLGFQDVRGVWQYHRAPTRDVAAKTVSVETTHFSDWSLLEGIQLKPLSAEVEVGGSLDLQLITCLHPDGETEGPIPSSSCGPAAAAFTAHSWAANGAVGGNSTAGTVAETGNGQGTARYTAPMKPPGKNPVAVSVRVSDLMLGDVTVVANVQVRPPANTWQGYVFYTETGRQPWKMQDGFEGAGSNYAKQTHTFKVVGETPVDAWNTTLLLEQEGSAEYSSIGHREKKIYEICQAFGEKILRHHFIYDRNFQMSGTVKATLEARLHLSDGHYSLSFAPKLVPMTGQDKTVDIYKDGCAHTVNDHSSTKPVNTSEEPLNTNVEGALDPAHPNVLKGKAEGSSTVFIQPTQYLLSWDLKRGP